MRKFDAPSGKPASVRVRPLLAFALAVPLAAGVLTGPLGPVAGARPARAAEPGSGGASDIGGLEAKVARLQHDIDRRQAALDALDSSIAARVEAIGAAERRRDELVGILSDRADAAYRYGMADSTLFAVLSSGRDPIEMADGLAKLGVINAGDVASEAEAEALRERLDLERRELDQARRSQADLLADLVRQQQVLAASLAVARAAAAATTLMPGAGTGAGVTGGSPIITAGMACPVSAPYQFIDSYGAARSGGRQHKGVDIFARHGSPIFAVEGGVVTRSRTNSLGGLYVWLVGDSGNEYYFAHNSANVVGAGTRVSAGQVIARVGNSGNAAGHTSHLHFEVHPGGGGAVNPTPFARRVCP